MSAAIGVACEFELQRARGCRAPIHYSWNPLHDTVKAHERVDRVPGCHKTKTENNSNNNQFSHPPTTPTHPPAQPASIILIVITRLIVAVAAAQAQGQRLGPAEHQCCIAFDALGTPGSWRTGKRPLSQRRARIARGQHQPHLALSERTRATIACVPRAGSGQMRKHAIGPAHCALAREIIGKSQTPASSRPIASTATSYPQRHRQLKLLLHKQPRRHRQHMRHAPR